jgi:hypothetical protein
VPAQAPDWPSPTRSIQLRLQLYVVGGNCKDVGAAHGAERLAQVPRGEQTILQIQAIDQKNIHLAVKLAVLEAIVQKM